MRAVHGRWARLLGSLDLAAERFERPRDAAPKILVCCIDRARLARHGQPRGDISERREGGTPHALLSAAPQIGPILSLFLKRLAIFRGEQFAQERAPFDSHAGRASMNFLRLIVLTLASRSPHDYENGWSGPAARSVAVSICN